MSYDSQYAVLTAGEMIAAERAAFDAGIPAFTLMLSAGRGFAKAVSHRKKPGKILFLNGPGNNGGDGWVAAELLRRKGWQVFCCALKIPDDGSCAAAEAYGKWQGEVVEFPDDLSSFDVIVDALFGTGLERPVEGRAAEWINAANETEALRIAVDIPSGISSDSGEVLGTAFAAGLTVTFSQKKRGHVLMPGLELCGDVEVVDIGIEPVAATVFENDPGIWKDKIPHPGKGDYKQTRGHLLVIGGEAGMSGAGRMAARAGLRSGAGLVTTLAPAAALSAYAEKQLAVMSRGYGSPGEFSEVITSGKFSAFVIGPGNGVGAETRGRVLEVLATGKPCALDADALTSFEGNPKALFKKLHENAVLTPHLGEFRRLWPGLDPSQDSGTDKITAVQKASARAGAVVLLKGPDTVIAHPGGRALVNVHASPHLATAGSGDVLAGIIGGFLTQKVAPLLAAGAGAWIHGEAGIRLGQGLIAEDLIEEIPHVLKKLNS
ncbi:MAG: NAD(P)H-hydrate dehydratase [Sphingomonadales bacterium]